MNVLIYSLTRSHIQTFLCVQRATLIILGDNRAYHLIDIIASFINSRTKENNYLN